MGSARGHIAPLLLSAAAALAPASASAQADAPTGLVRVERLALVVAHKDGGPGRATLAHARADAETFAAVLTDLGGVRDRDVVMVIDEDRHTFESRLADLSAEAARRHAAGLRVELVVYYSGHADEAGLLLGKEQLPWTALRARIEAAAADVKLVVLDACSSGAAVRNKGGTRRPPLLVDEGKAPRGHAYLTSSTADEASQESDRIGGSYFTHALVAGLRGAADLSGDGQVTLDEAYRFAFHETLARTETTLGGAQHASYDVALQGSGELVLTDLRDRSGRLVLTDDVSGRVFVRDSAARRLVAEVTKLKGRALPLVLPPGGYDVVVVEGPLAKRALARVTSVGATVTGASFAPVSLEDAVPRGLLPLTHFPINLGFISPLEINSYAPRVSNNVGVTVLFGRAARIYGAGLSLGGNFVDEELAGAVFGLGFNGAAGPVTGGMFGTANVALSDVTGAQGGVLFNLGTSRTTGAAWAVANVHRSLVGAQLGLVNVALDVSGLQLGLVNIAGTARGAQVGLVNIAEHSTAPIGLASLVGDGQASVGVYGSDLALVGLEARAGGRHLYSQLRGGATPLLGDGRWQPVLTAGLGASTGSLPAAIGALSLELDVSGGVMGAAPLGTALVRARLRPAPFVSLSAGPELRVAPRAPAGAVAAAVGGAAVWPGIVIGLSL